MMARQLVDEGWGRLEAAGVPEARVKMEWWVSEALGIGRDALDDSLADEKALDRVRAGMARLERHEPLQYVIGHAPFLNADILTDARALIPRPETEELVMRVLGCAPLWSRGRVRVADVGTGTGCIAIALAAARPSASVLAIDRCGEALSLAAENVERNGVAGRVELLRGDLLNGVAPESLDAVVSNPPYISRPVLESLEDSVRCFEPRGALDGGEDGLDILRTLAKQAYTTLKDDGRIWLEIGDEQGEAVRGLLEQEGFREVEVVRDMYGQTRFAEAMK